MLELIRELLTSSAGSFGFLFALICIGAWLIYWVTKKVTQIQSDHSILNKSVDKIDKSIDEIRRDMSFLKGSIDVMKSGGSNQLLQSKSPVTLTEKGIEVAKELKANDIIARTWNKIFEILEREISNKNAYDIQQFCIEQVSIEPEKFFDNEGVISIKNFAYKEGNPLQLYTRMLGVLIRDKYMKAKGISIDEIDKHDPSKQ
ncbi:MAG: hypothetical protein KG029_09800 [Bacteroidetes bacterium]|nr:hypothetical protein [Bacteroidota bacterium]